MAAKRRMTKQAAGSLTCDGAPLTVIDEAAITTRRVELRCQCDRRHMIDVTPAVRIAIDEATVGAFQLPAGDYEALVVYGHAGTFISGVLRKI